MQFHYPQGEILGLVQEATNYQKESPFIIRGSNFVKQAAESSVKDTALKY